MFIQLSGGGEIPPDFFLYCSPLSSANGVVTNASNKLGITNLERMIRLYVTLEAMVFSAQMPTTEVAIVDGRQCTGIV